MDANVYCREEYERFFDCLDAADCTLDAVTLAARSALPDLAAASGLGRFAVSLRTRPTAISPDGFAQELVLYDAPAGYEAQRPQVMQVPSQAGVSFRTTFWPLTGHSFSAEEQHSLEFISRSLFLFGCRGRLFELLDQAMLMDLRMEMFNQAGFMQHIRSALGKGKLTGYVAFFFNLCQFKYANRVLGYQGATQLLLLYAQTLRQYLRGSGQCIAHLGGDNFVALVCAEWEGEFLSMLQDLPLSVMGKGEQRCIHLKARAGGCRLDDTIHSPEDVMMRISFAHSQARRNNQQLVYFNQEEYERGAVQRELVTAVPQALKLREFVVVYQPKVHLQTKQLAGAEALVRWNRQGQLLLPGMFVPLLEQDGSICQLDFYVLERTCEDIARWKREHRPLLPVSVNLSRCHLPEEDTVERIMAIVQRYGIEPSLLEFELTETVDNEDYQALEALMAELHAHGLRTSIDDFGTGYSSLTLLQTLPVDALKLDKSFLQSGQMEGRGSIVFEEVIRMAVRLRIGVVAEGAETQQQVDYLRRLEVATVQGYFYDRPLSCQDYEARLDRLQYD